VQYLAALAVVEGIKTYDHGYFDMPVKLKWPNDICEPASHAHPGKCDMLTISEKMQKIPPNQVRKNMSKSAASS
jgi:biotin-(acetyl-CoA carboxylase) ligase